MGSSSSSFNIILFYSSIMEPFKISSLSYSNSVHLTSYLSNSFLVKIPIVNYLETPQTLAILDADLIFSLDIIIVFIYDLFNWSIIWIVWSLGLLAYIIKPK